MLAVFTFSCIEKEPDYQNFKGKDVDFVFAVSGNEYQRDFYYVSTLQFTNTSAKSGAVTWDFGDGSTSNEANPTHKYDKSGNYKVTLTVDGVGSRTYPVLVMDIVPEMSITSQSDSILIINDVSIELGLSLPNPDNLKCKYLWRMPEGTTLADGTPISEFEGYSHEDGSIDNPGALKFKNVGSQKIEIQTYFDIEGENRRLSDSYINVQVGYNQEVPTLYYANYGGNVKAYKLIPEGTLPEGTKNLPFDMGVSSGNTPQNLVFASVQDGDVSSDYIYILDCGKNFMYQGSPETLGDGKITVMSADGSYADLVITNVGGHAFSDPFSGCADDKNLYYNDRNSGISSIELSTRGVIESRVYGGVDSYMVVNNYLGYYNDGIVFGAVSTGLAIHNGVFYWPKSYSGKGIYRFTRSDILSAADADGGNAPHPVLLAGITPKAFAIDATRKHMYVWQTTGTTPGAGFTQYPLVGIEESLATTDYTKFVKMDALQVVNSTDEGLYVTQFAIDETNGNVYFGFNSNADANYPTGIYYYDYAAGVVKNFAGSTDKALGICINPRKTKLF